VGFGATNYLWHKGFHDLDMVLDRNPIVGRSVVRKEVYLEAGGMPESARNGLEDWEFWLCCASKGHWGLTVPEFLDWYRRRADHSDRWSDWDGGAKEDEFRTRMRARFPDLYRRGVPRIQPSSAHPYPVLEFTMPLRNPLAKKSGLKRMLCIFPHLELGGADKFNLDMIGELQARYGYQVTVATTLNSAHRWRHRFESLTPDVFTLDTFLPMCDYPRFLCYLIESRDVDVVLISHSQLAYLLTPLLRAFGPDRAVVDYLHMEEDNWKFGNYPRYSLNYSALMDLTIVSSAHLKEWMIARDGDTARIEVCTTNVDSEDWNRTRFNAKYLRAKYELPPDLPVISFAARLTDQKQPRALAEVIRLLRDRGARFVCLVAGDGPHLDFLAEYVAKHSLPELRLLGARSNADVREILAISDIYFMPSAFEGIALVLYEAMAMGVVPVSAAVGGQAELVTPECGYLIEHGPNEVMAYVQVLTSLLLDGGLRRTLADAARRRVVQYFELRQMGIRMSELLDKAIASPRCFPELKKTGATAAVEAIEQHRLETLANDLWAARGENPDRGARRNIAPLDEPAGYIEYYEYLRRLRALLGGNVFAATGLLRNRECSALGLAKSIGLLYSGGTRSATRRMLRRVLGQPAGRALLAKNFRPHDYLARHPDVRAAHLDPLLHYVARGVAEDRIPAVGMRRGAPILEEAAEAMDRRRK
jgi:glycosyltransferase involved in cell wall biosynthesis